MDDSRYELSEDVMGTLYIDRKNCHIRLDGNALAFYSNGQKEGIVPIEPVKRVIFIGNMAIETSVLRRFSDMGISAIFLSGRRLRFSGMMHGRLHNNAILRLRQYKKAISGFAREFAQEIVMKKVKSQLVLLKEAIETRHDIRLELTESIKSLEEILKRLYSESFTIESLKGIEGSASAGYFKAYSNLFAESLNFKRRTRRPPLDPVNAMLSLCYTLLHFELVREIEVIGLDPFIGFYHQFEYGRESLACDLVELFRTDADRFVWKIFKDREFTAQDFSKDHEDGGCYLRKNKRKDFYHLYENWARGMRQAFTEEVRILARRLNDEKDTLSE
ncbi:MAG: CRISPR-associated endonuclease Cas1 [Thermodesulfovibrionia bacterium]